MKAMARFLAIVLMVLYIAAGLSTTCSDMWFSYCGHGDHEYYYRLQGLAFAILSGAYIFKWRHAYWGIIGCHILFGLVNSSEQFPLIPKLGIFVVVLSLIVFHAVARAEGMAKPLTAPKAAEKK